MKFREFSTEEFKEEFERQWKEIPDIIHSIGFGEIGAYNSFSRKGLLKLLKEKCDFIRQVVKELPIDKVNEIYHKIEKHNWEDDDYTRDSKRITCETSCEHNSMTGDTQMGEIIYCNKYLVGEEDKCPNRSWLTSD